MSYINISGYTFIKLKNLETLQRDLKARCIALNLKGTILLGEEGINLFLCGTRSEINHFYDYLRSLQFPSIEFKESISTHPPFDRMLVKIKPEIITMGVQEIDPIEKPAPRISPEMFKRWLDEEKPLIILDTRNTYEVRIGKFKNAIDVNIQHFRQFKEAVKTLPAEFKNATVVTYCTGGIRCEKAAPYLIEQGFKDVYQLDGGILKYLEEYGNTHYEGECFVFDKRIAVDANLDETPTIQCIHCREPVTVHEQASVHFEPGRSCPNCYEK